MSEPLASRQDVEDNYRTLAPHEASVVDSWLRTASAQLRVQVADVDARCEVDDSYRDLVTGIVALAVIRKLQGADPRDPSQETNIYFRRVDLEALSGTSGGALSPLGMFPVAVPLPCSW